jgi:AraC-like DNA-binding protein
LKARVLYNEIVQQLLFHPRNNLNLIKNKALELVIILTQTATSKGADVKVVTQLRNRAYMELDEMESLDLFIPWMGRLYNQFEHYTLNSSDSKHAKTVRDAITFILEHYSEKITLKDVAAHVAFAPTYFCTLLKTETGQNFRSCLNRIRVEKSKELLDDDGISIADIAYRVGFTDQSYFARVFKRQEGMSPYQYRLTCRPFVVS